MAEYIKREAAIKAIDHEVSLDGLYANIKAVPAADVRPERRGHVVWRERHSGGFRTVKCLYEFPDIIKENNIACKHIAKFDNRCTVKEPYCSECGKRLGDFINFCGNCGAKMDEKDGESDENR